MKLLKKSSVESRSRFGRCFIRFFAWVFIISMLISSCASSNKEEGYSDINYGEEDVVNDRVRDIEKLLEKKSLEALWQSSILLKNAPEFSQSSEIFDKCQDEVVKQCNNYIEEKNYLDACRLYKSLVAVESTKIDNIKIDLNQITRLMEEGNPVKNSPAKTEKVSTMINGTVTVLVDKGVKIESGMGYNDAMLGSGFFITKNGYIITNHHVISDCVDPKYNGYARLYIKLAEDSETRIPARVIGYDKTMDLALLKTEVDAPYVFNLGSSSDLDVGDRIFVIGSPLGLERTLTSGIVSTTDRDLLSLGKVFQIDAAVGPGNSGGPMIDEKGNVLAVVFAGIQNYQGLNFAIPVEYLKAELNFLMAGGKRVHPWMEAFGKTKRLAGSGAKNQGLEILYTLPGGKANFSGLDVDDLIIKIDQTKITSMDDLHLYLLSQPSDSIVSVTCEKADGSGTKTLPVYLAPRPENPGYTFYSGDLLSSSLYPIMGMELVRTSTSNKKQYSVKKVLKNSSADAAGLDEGDPIQILDTVLDDEKTYLGLGIYAKKKKSGYLDYRMGLTASLDSSLYF